MKTTGLGHNMILWGNWTVPHGGSNSSFEEQCLDCQHCTVEIATFRKQACMGLLLALSKMPFNLYCVKLDPTDIPLFAWPTPQLEEEIFIPAKPLMDVSFVIITGTMVIILHILYRALHYMSSL